MMNPAFHEILSATDGDRRDLFLTASRRLGTTEQNVEKDFWVCWALDALFNGLEAGGPRLLFKGGTSLSKSFGLIQRFSEDIDVTVFRDDIGQPASVAELEAMSGKKRKVKLDAIRAACQAYIANGLQSELTRIITTEFAAAGVSPDRASVTLDADDPDYQTLLFAYPGVVAPDAYVRPVVRIESGAKSALDPHRLVIVKPYINDDLDRLNLAIPGVVTVEPIRTFWDKVVILHGLRRWFDRRNVLRQEGQRVSRHYYDLYRLMQSEIGPRAITDREIAIDCARHAKMFFDRPDFDLEHAVPGTLSLVPVPAMLDALRRDYAAMSGMIFGPVPDFNHVMAAIADLEGRVNVKET